ncbi:MAG TPA: cystathionine beta-synthase [Candidatus Thermoplasmatota archaeon]|nr:cystathionine beta-synthase [Candidatus Thermoplasmatota archaeon]
MRYAQSVLDLIGDTPLVKLNRVVPQDGPLVLAKLEMRNPGGSVKDRIGIAMLEAAEKEGTLRPGGTIVEGTSGNTGVGLAIAAAIRGYKAIFTMPDKMSAEKIRLLRAYGAEVVVTPTAVPPEHPMSYYSVARRIQRETPNCFYPNQYENQANPLAHYRTTGPEIWQQTEGRIDVLVAGVGTGGTISGAAKFLKEKNPRVRVVGVDPEGSILAEYKRTGKVGTTLKTYKVEGIGEDIVPKSLWPEHIDEIVTVNDRESLQMARRIAREEGILAGGSTGSAVAGLLKWLRANPKGPETTIVVLFPDTGERYLSKIYDDNWMRENRLLEDDVSLEALLRAKAGDAPRELLSIRPEDTVASAIETMNHKGVSQIPVLDDRGRNVGSLVDHRLLNKILENRMVLDYPVAKHMDPPFPEIDADAGLPAATELLKTHAAVLVRRGGKLAGILTKFDLAEFLLGTHGK